MERVIKYSIIILILLVVSILIILMFYRDKEDIIYDNIDEESFEVTNNTSISKVTSNDIFYSIKNCVQNYIDYTNDENYEAIYSILDKNYINEKNVTIKNLKKYITKFDEDKFIANIIYVKDINIEISVYYVYGKLVDDKYENEKEQDFTVIINNSKNIFAIIPESLENIDSYEYNLNIVEDVENKYNAFIYQAISEEKMLLEYFNYYKDLAVNNSQKAFLLLDEEYREKRFNNSQESYVKYLKNVDIVNVFPEKYMCDVYDDYKEYICIDKNGIYYIFKVVAPMEFKLKLDTYTIQSDKFITEYDTANDEKKVMINVDKWISMIKNKDYENAYNILDETFRTTNFNKKESFEEYLKNNIPAKYLLEYKEQKYIGDGIYTQTIELVGEGENISKTLVIRLEENREFVLSFEV